MPTSSETFNRVVDTLSKMDAFQNNPQNNKIELTAETDLVKDLNFPLEDKINVLYALEEEFSYSNSNTTNKNNKSLWENSTLTIGGLVQYVGRHMS